MQGRRIALAQSGGQFQSFLWLADHFGLHRADFQFVGFTDEAADYAFSRGQADAIFRVRALGNPSIQKLVESGRVRFLLIEHAAAMNIKHPAFEPAVIPEAAYLGSPPVPPQDLATVAQQANSLPSLEDIWRDLLAILEGAGHHPDADKLSEESFNSFRSILQIVMDVTRERRAILAMASPAASVARR